MASITYSPGKADHNGSGRRNCRVTFKIGWDGKRFSVCAYISNPRETGCYACGQIVDEAADYFPDDAKVQLIRELWRRWHLNDMRSGSPAQVAELARHTFEYWMGSHFNWARNVLTAAGLEPDQSYVHNGKPYEYGAAWLCEEVTPEDVARIESLFE